VRDDSLQIPALCPDQERRERHFPCVIPFPPRTPLPGYRFCSSASQVLWDHLTSQERACRLYRLRRFPAVPTCRGTLETRGISRFSRLEFPRMLQVLRLGRVGRRLTRSVAVRVAFPTSGQGRHAEGMISELYSWPACTPCPCHTHDVTVISVGFGAERLARPFSYDSFIRDSRPVYPGAFPDPFLRPSDRYRRNDPRVVQGLGIRFAWGDMDSRFQRSATTSGRCPPHSGSD